MKKAKTNFDKKLEYLAGQEITFIYSTGKEGKGFVAGAKVDRGITIQRADGMSLFCLNFNDLPSWLPESRYGEAFIYTLNCIEGGVIGDFIDVDLGYAGHGCGIMHCAFKDGE